MLNLKPYNGEAYDIYLAAVKAKQEGDVKTRLESISPEVKTCFTSYQEKFDRKELELLTANAACGPFAADLRSLYAFKNSVIRKLKGDIDDLQHSIIANVCQNCTINSVNSMDHVLAQSTYPEFTVHPVNLFPSCNECNGYKSKTLTKEGKKQFLNLYLDELPEEQYLFADISRDSKGDLTWDFRLENTAGIDAGLFDIISNHYKCLYLPARMRKQAIKYVGELRNAIKTGKRKRTIDEVCEDIIETANENRKVLGHNHFQFILEITLAQHPEFLKEFIAP